jgi:protein-S-isoprenylcysteine O-methyltransferase Ste14
MQILNNENFFFVSFLLVFLVGWILRAYFSRNSPDYKKSLSELKRQPLEHETPLSLGLLSLFGIILLVGVIIYAFYQSVFPWMQLPVPSLARWVGVIMGVICLPLIGWVQSALGESFSKTLTIQEGHELVTTGPYSRIRHPIYSVHTFWFLSWFLISTNLLFAVSWIIWIVYLQVRIPQEEQMLIEQFGNEYEEYMKKTGRLFP